ncbi:riboflavin synthase [Actinoalloteichus hymeniacidonis]|uniref:Riboflavin synthase n=1 Tax=Actinoalloteichus hymeniacidonis TaxID=340345 RepID=A0AAC9HPM4_9PSEU|nr:riboflavin synthase [Actinoalloteichus hymeniacidonis]AOS63130.1 riboflavin synthase alpha chain [Actinoalloteichus hymeniacidonis]MBB5908834.1 riboflavin synthase [Actinoalloteichus hymeniacidonis]
MFTGIVEELGEIREVTRLADAARLTVAAPTVVSDARHGDSIAVNGVCLTVVDVLDGAFTTDVMLETLRRSNLDGIAEGDAVNLERALAVSARFGGHIVQGHVDGFGAVLERTPAEHWELVRIELPQSLARYVVEKGSIAVDGVSLTVAAVDADSFTVSLIPTTLELTTLGHRTPGARVNLEVDVLAKYVEKLTAAPAAALGTSIATGTEATR